MLITATIIIIIIGCVHSWLGEKTVIGPVLAKTELPAYIRRLLRVAWHITTLFWFAIGTQLISMQLYAGHERQSFLIIMGITFGISAIIAFVFSKGKHLSWAGFGTLAIILTYEAIT